jgi:hypothetical protein
VAEGTGGQGGGGGPHGPNFHAQLHDAMKQAWDDQKAALGDPPYEVDKILVDGNNPLTGYSVVLRRPT